MKNKELKMRAIIGTAYTNTTNIAYYKFRSNYAERFMAYIIITPNPALFINPIPKIRNDQPHSFLL